MNKTDFIYIFSFSQYMFYYRQFVLIISVVVTTKYVYAPK